MISIIDLSSELGVRKQTVFKIARRLKIETTKLKTESARGQAVAHISETDADRIRMEITASEMGGDFDADESASGWFYLVQLEPEMDPNRVKLGFATDIDQRLRAHRTSAPFSKINKQWPCRLRWEKTAIDCISSGSQRLHTEVFRVEDLNSTIDLADRFFALLPDPNE